MDDAEFNCLADKVVKDISKNHRKIIDDWCKAHLAQMYEEGHELKPGSFTLIQQQMSIHEGKVGFKYWFEKGVPERTIYHDLGSKNNEEKLKSMLFEFLRECYDSREFSYYELEIIRKFTTKFFNRNYPENAE